MYGLAKKAYDQNIDVGSIIANGAKRINQLDDLAGLAIVANGKKNQANAQNQGQQEPQPKPAKLIS